MKHILLLGCGKIGQLIAELLASSGDYSITVADNNRENLRQLPEAKYLKSLSLDITDSSVLENALAGKYAVLSACPFYVNQHVARAAVKGVHYLDLTEDVRCTRLVKSLSRGAGNAFIPQCGLAPGFITIVTYELAKQFDELHNVHMRVGALPKYPSNALKYNLTWSTDGLINQYCNPCDAIIEGKLTQVPPLEELETFALDGVTYEAFNTSGGLGTLCETLEGKVINLNYRSVRYPGHRDIMKILLQDLRLRDRQPLLKEIFESSLPLTYQDVVLIFVNVSGYKKGQLVQETYVNKIYSQKINGRIWSAIQVTTASGICAILDLLVEGKVPDKGFVRQEDILFDDFIGNRFGQYYLRQPEGEAKVA